HVRWIDDVADLARCGCTGPRAGKLCGIPCRRQRQRDRARELAAAWQARGREIAASRFGGAGSRARALGVAERRFADRARRHSQPRQGHPGAPGYVGRAAVQRERARGVVGARVGLAARATLATLRAARPVREILVSARNKRNTSAPFESASKWV